MMNVSNLLPCAGREGATPLLALGPNRVLIREKQRQRTERGPTADSAKRLPALASDEVRTDLGLSPCIPQRESPFPRCWAFEQAFSLGERIPLLTSESHHVG
jgi:hypothetical protein